MPRAFTAAARSSRECGPRAWSVGSPPPTRKRSPVIVRPSCVPVARTSVTSVSVWGRSDRTPMAVNSFWFEAGVSGRSALRAATSPSPSAHTDNPTVVPARRGSARWESTAPARAAAAGDGGGGAAAVAAGEAAAGGAGSGAGVAAGGAGGGTGDAGGAGAAGPDGALPAGAGMRCWAVPAPGSAMWECSTRGGGRRSCGERKPSGPGAKATARIGARRTARRAAGRSDGSEGGVTARICRRTVAEPAPEVVDTPTDRPNRPALTNRRSISAGSRQTNAGWSGRTGVPQGGGGAVRNAGLKKGRWGAPGRSVVVVGGRRRGRGLGRGLAFAPHGGRGLRAGAEVGGLVDEGHHDPHGVGDGLRRVVDRLQVEHLALAHRADPVPGADAHRLDRALVGGLPAPAGPAGAEGLAGGLVGRRGG